MTYETFVRCYNDGTRWGNLAHFICLKYPRDIWRLQTFRWALNHMPRPYPKVMHTIDVFTILFIPQTQGAALKSSVWCQVSCGSKLFMASHEVIGRGRAGHWCSFRLTSLCCYCGKQEKGSNESNMLVIIFWKLTRKQKMFVLTFWK